MKTEAYFILAPAAPGDERTISALLAAAGLPHQDIGPHLKNFLVARRENQVIGAIGAEVYGADALLRSLVVAPAHRGAGVASRLVTQLERVAGGWGVARWWLLTTTAQAFFERRGFVITARTQAPAAIAATNEFQDLCPSTAICLSRARRE